MRHNLFEIGAITRGEMYAAAVFPEMYPEEKPFRLGNWSEEEREAWCGVYSK